MKVYATWNRKTLHAAAASGNNAVQFSMFMSMWIVHMIVLVVLHIAVVKRGCSLPHWCRGRCMVASDRLQRRLELDGTVSSSYRHKVLRLVV